MKKIFIALIVFIFTLINLQAQEIGSITIDAVQDRVTIYLNEKFYGIASGLSTIENLESGTYTITISKENYINQQGTINLKHGENKILKIDLQKKSEYKKDINKKNNNNFLLLDTTFCHTGLLDYNVLLHLKPLTWLKLQTGMINPGFFFKTGNQAIYFLPSLDFKHFEFGVGIGTLSLLEDFLVPLTLRIGSKQGFSINSKLYLGSGSGNEKDTYLDIRDEDTFLLVVSHGFSYWNSNIKIHFSNLFNYYFGLATFGDVKKDKYKKYMLLNKSEFGRAYSGINFILKNYNINVEGGQISYYGRLGSYVTDTSYIIDTHIFHTYFALFTLMWKNQSSFHPFIGCGLEINNQASLFIMKIGFRYY